MMKGQAKPESVQVYQKEGNEMRELFTRICRLTIPFNGNCIEQQQQVVLSSCHAKH